MLDRVLLMERVGGDEKLLLEITETFLQESTTMLADLRQALLQRDLKRVERLAHTLKGSISIFGLDSATGAAFRLEDNARSGKPDNLDALYAALASEHAKLSRELDQLKASLAGSTTDSR